MSVDCVGEFTRKCGLNTFLTLMENRLYQDQPMSNVLDQLGFLLDQDDRRTLRYRRRKSCRSPCAHTFQAYCMVLMKDGNLN